MRLFRATNSMVLDVIRPHVLAFDMPAEAYLSSIQQVLRMAPDNLYVIVPIEDQQCHGFAIVHASPGVNFVFVEQAWASQLGSERRVMDQIFARVVTWVEYIGRNEIRFETRRDPKSILRKYGFEPFSTVMSYKITAETEDDVIERLLQMKLKRGDDNGTGKHETVERGHTDEQAGVHAQETGELPERQDRTESDTILGGSGSPAGAAVQSGGEPAGTVQSTAVSATGEQSTGSDPGRTAGTGDAESSSSV